MAVSRREFTAEAGHHRKRERDESDEGAGAFLEQPILGPAGARADPQLQVALKLLPAVYPRPFVTPRNQRPPEVAGENSVEQVDGSGNDKKPGGKKMETPPPAVLIENHVGAAGADRGIGSVEEWDTLVPAPVLMIPADGEFEESWRQVVAHFAPIEPWMAHEDDEAADRQGQKADGHNSVGAADPKRVSWQRGESF